MFCYKGDDVKYLHTMVRVKDIDESLDFYCSKLGMIETRRVENRVQKEDLDPYVTP